MLQNANYPPVQTMCRSSYIQTTESFSLPATGLLFWLSRSLAAPSGNRPDHECSGQGMKWLGCALSCHISAWRRVNSGLPLISSSTPIRCTPASFQRLSFIAEPALAICFIDRSSIVPRGPRRMVDVPVLGNIALDRASFWRDLLCHFPALVPEIPRGLCGCLPDPFIRDANFVFQLVEVMREFAVGPSKARLNHHLIHVYTVGKANRNYAPEFINAAIVAIDRL
jgi:hypothetical protein